MASSFYRIRYHRPNPDRQEGGRITESQDTAGAVGLADVLKTVSAYVEKKVNTDRVEIFFCEPKEGGDLREDLQWVILAADRAPAVRTAGITADGTLAL